jgi:hypothetical protein
LGQGRVLGGLRLVGLGGERVSGGQREWLARAGAGGGAAAPILLLNKNLAWISFSTFSQTLKTEGEVLLQ